MARIVFQLGREWEICFFELRQVAATWGLKPEPLSDSLAEIRDFPFHRGLASFCNQLGGTTRAIYCWDEDPPSFRENFQKGKVFLPKGPWAVSTLEEDLALQREEIRQFIKDLINDHPQARGREERTIPGDTQVVPSRVFQNVLQRGGAEVCLWREGSEVRYGKTEWIFSPEEYADRDIGKPNRPRRRGLLPPKLARQMVNLARTPDMKTLLDPFCGSGVILIEGLALKLCVWGSDFRDEALDQSRENLEWFRTGSTRNPELVKGLTRVDARQLSLSFRPLSFDAVVGEGDLGPPLRGPVPRKTAISLAKSLERLYIPTFAEIRTILKPGGRVCLAVPFWIPEEGDPIEVNLKRRLALMGYQPVLPDRGFDPLQYNRPGQRVGRALYVLESPL